MEVYLERRSSLQEKTQMQITEFIPTPKPENTVKLGDTKPGDMVRYANIPFDKALEESAFWLVMADDNSKDGRKRMVSVKDWTTIVLRDPDHLVVIHGAELMIRR